MAGVLLAAGTTVAGAQAAVAANPDGSFQMMAATGKCLEVVPDPNGNFFIAGNRIQQRTCDGSPQQQWFLDDLGGQFHDWWPNHPKYHIVNRMTLQCLDDTGGGTSNRNPVQQWPCNPTSDTMIWGLFAIGNPLGDEVVNSRASKCLDVTDGSLADGTPIQIYNCFGEGNIAQHFTMN